MHRVVIIGGGFGGLQAAKMLSRSAAQVVLIDRRNFHLFQPLLYQVATGGLSPGDIASPLRSILRKQKDAAVLMGTAVDIDVDNRKVILENGELEYDSLIVATGCTHSYFGHPEWELSAPGLKTIEDATGIRRKILFAFEAAEREANPERRRALLTFVVVGAGPTGVELAGSLGSIANDTLKDDFRSIRPQEARILLLDAAPRVLPTYPPELSARAEKSLIALGVRPILNCTVVGVDDEGLDIENGSGPGRIASHTVLWAAGVAASELGGVLSKRTGALLDKAGRVIVESDLTIPGWPEIFVIGDLAHFEQDGKPLPGVAPVAMQQGRYVGKLITARLKGTRVPSFRYLNKGNLATIGRASAVADFGFVRFGGHFAWITWLLVHLMYLVGFQNRLVVFLKWAYEYLTFNRGARLITGENPPLPRIVPPGPGSCEVAYISRRSPASGETGKPAAVS
ncbi:MAG: NAD(P)/FAD-dependent oxidoreductase [Bryobacterales bacterium]|nr:NAD(P)/FAD-dependent oxidoreductase [Bryobacterales bacterium]MEB2364311.1 NAD(P)/FAD-dependent oxidoreductase [Bryobacterales bacterium]